MNLVVLYTILKCTAMYIALWHCGIERKLSVHFLPNLMSKNHIIGKPEARAQAVGMSQAGSTQA